VENSSDVLRHVMLAFGAGDWDRMRELVSDDLACVDIAAGGDVTIGGDAFVQTEKNWRGAFSDFQVEILAVVGDDTHAAGDMILRGRHTGPLPTPWGDIPATGRNVELPFVLYCQVVDSRLTEVRDHYNPSLAMTQIGVAPNSVGA
jgi:predicted ester cyclase